VGILGVGFMGWIHFLAYRRLRGVKVVAVATRDPAKQKGDWRAIRGNFGPPGEQVDLRGISVHAAMESLLQDPRVDVVDICLPPSMHCQAAEAAFRAGKHVICEKPIALSPREADRMVAAARTARKQLTIAQVLPYFPEYAYALKAARQGRYGRFIGGHFKRIIADPVWVKDFYHPRGAGGPLVDLHVHDAHFIRLLAGMPVRVDSRGRMRGEVVEFFTSQFVFADRSLVVSATGGVLPHPARGFNHGFEIHFEKAAMLFDFSVLDGQPVASMPLTVVDSHGNCERPALGSTDPIDAFAAELSEAVSAVRTGKSSAVLSGDLARDALLLCRRQAQSVELGRSVKV
jgi:predicted dehydrogenase